MSDVGFYHPLIVHFVIALAIVGVLFRWASFTGAARFTGSAWIASCFITPGADPYSPLIVGGAFTALYFVSEGLIRILIRSPRLA